MENCKLSTHVFWKNMIILLQFYSLWLPIKFRISYKIYLLAYKALYGLED